MISAYLDRLVDLAVTFAANVQPGQIVALGATLGQEDLARAVARSAYRHGALFVDVSYFDPWVKRARLEHAAEETLGFVPSWYGQRILEQGRQRCARISLAGPAPLEALAGIDPRRAGRDQLPFLREVLEVVNARLVNWTVIPGPTPAWAALVFPDLAPEEAHQRLWEEIGHCCRLDEPDPAAAWRERASELEAVAARLTEARLDALRFRGPGTDLIVGLFPAGRWQAAREETVEGITHLANLPSEEVFTTPDPARTEGEVRSTRPLVLDDGVLVRGLRVRFRAGRAVAVEAEEGAEVLRGRIAVDEGACRLGEVALVDGASRVGRRGRVFYETLLDENAVSHIAFGDGDPALVPERHRSRRNASAIHIDFMVGGEEVEVTGLTRDGGTVPLLAGGRWLL